MNHTILRPLILALALACASFAPATAFASPILTQAQNHLFITPGFDAVAYQVRVSGPNGFVGEQTWLPEERITLTAPKSGWVDGDYRVEVWPILAIEGNDAEFAANARAPWAPVEGTFTAHDGALYLADATSGATSEHDTYSKDRLIPDDLVVRGSSCIGLDCVANESFGFDTVRLKENNTRLKFEDTSTGTGFAGNDWQLTANDAGTGGANKFSIDDVTGGKTPFTVLAGAPTNSMFVDASGNVGLGTSTPAAKLHVAGALTTTGVPTFLTNVGFIGKAGPGLGGNWRYVDDTGTQRWLTGILGTAGATAFSIYNIATSTEAMRIDNAGQVSFGAGLNSTPIGATTPSTGAFTTLSASNIGVGIAPGAEKLFVNGGRLRVASGGAEWAYFSASSPGASYMGFAKGIGGTAGYIGTDGGGIISGGTGANFGMRAEADLMLIAGGAERMRLHASGNVGIGSSTSADFRLFSYQNAPAGSSALAIRQDGAGDIARFLGAAGAEKMRITSTGNVGIGTAAPSEKLEVNGNIKATGNITITGSLSQGSDRHSKENFAPVDPEMVLDKIEDLDVTRWNYIVDGEGVQHIGPMAQDFYAAFGLGESDTKIAPLDTSGVALVAIKGLQQELHERDAAIGALQIAMQQRDAQIAALNAKLEQRDAALAAINAKLDALSETVAEIDAQHDVIETVPAANRRGAAAPAPVEL